MLEKIEESLGRWYMTVVSGVFLAFSMALLIVKSAVKLEASPYLDPAWVTIVISGVPIACSAIKKLIKNKKITSALLITVAMIASICIGEIFAAGEVAFIMAIGEILEHKTVHRAKKGLKNLLSLTPTTARVLVKEDGVTVEKIIPVKEVKIGMTVRVFAGETIPVDGKITNGNTSVNQAVMTGESVPVDKGVGDGVFCGTLNCFGVIDVVATVINENSSLQKMIKLIKDAEKQKAPMQRIADKWATWLVFVAIFASVVAGVVSYLLIGNANNVALVRAVTILVVFCPCSLVLATPTSVMAGIGQATKQGIIIKSGEALESMGKTSVIAFDKTGTLTTGKLSVCDVVSFDGKTKNELLSIVATIESKSEHPLGKAIVDNAKKLNVTIFEVKNFNLIAGKGVSGELNDNRYLCGNAKYLKENGVAIKKEQAEKIDMLRRQGKVVVLVAENEKLIGAVALFDTIRESAKETVRKLKRLGYKIVLLTGDNATTAKYFAEKVEITDVRSELLPEDKVRAIKSLQKDGYAVAMVGDGINDAPALKVANVGIAMCGIGSDITEDASGILLVSNDVGSLPYLAVLSRSISKTIKFNICLSMAINFVAIVLSSLGLLTPISGAFVHNVGSVFVVLNASLAHDRKYDKKAEKI